MLGTSSLKSKRTLKSTIFIYLSIFAFLIIGSIWIFRIFFFDNYYESNKIDELEATLSTFEKKYNENDESFYKLLENNFYERGICSELLKDNEIIYTTYQSDIGCMKFYEDDKKALDDKEQFLKNKEKKLRINVDTEIYNSEILLFGLKLDDNHTLFMNGSIEPIGSTVTIIRNHFIYITILVIIISLVLAYYLAKDFSTPIVELTNKSIELSRDNLKVDFNVDSNIIEINELAESLNYGKEVLKKNDELRRDLMANVSHDLKTPLTMIKAYAEMVRDFSYKDRVKRENDLNIIMDEVDRLNVLVNDILDLSKLENNIEELNIEELNISSLVDTIIGRFKIFSLTQDCEFITHYDKNIMIMTDKQKMEQVIYNLIGNAINYSNDNKHIYVTILNRKDEVRVFITDTGPGIKKEKIKDIWNKYYKIDKKYKRNIIGTGLGLSIVKHIFDQHNYKYGIVSKEDLGTTFYFIVSKKKNRKN